MKQEYIDIHNAIHSNATEVVINNQKYPIQKTASGLRFVDYDDIRWMEQNKNKQSLFALKAKQGEHITWGMRQGGWIYIDDKTKTNTVTVTNKTRILG